MSSLEEESKSFEGTCTCIAICAQLEPCVVCLFFPKTLSSTALSLQFVARMLPPKLTYPSSLLGKAHLEMIQGDMSPMGMKAG